MNIVRLYVYVHNHMYSHVYILNALEWLCVGQFRAESPLLTGYQSILASSLAVWAYQSTVQV